MSRAATVRCLYCRQERSHAGRGLCSPCHRRLKGEGRLEQYELTRTKREPAPKRQVDDEIPFVGRWERRGLVLYPVKEAS